MSHQGCKCVKCSEASSICSGSIWKQHETVNNNISKAQLKKISSNKTPLRSCAPINIILCVPNKPWVNSSKCFWIKKRRHYHVCECLHLLLSMHFISVFIWSFLPFIVHPSMTPNKHWQEKWHLIVSSAECSAAKSREDLRKVKQGAHVSLRLFFPDGHAEGAVWSEI